jgi:predicted amidohydrolase
VKAVVKRMGLWLAPPATALTPRRQVRQLLDQLHRQSEQLDGLPSLVLFPEAWHNSQASDRHAVRQEVLDVVAPVLDGAGVRCIVGAESGRGEQLLIDSASPQVYAKHSTARRIAFEADAWSEDSALPVWPGGVGPTICHDMYLALLDHSLASRGARTLVNPSFDDVVRPKWETVLRGRALEARAPIACTMNQRRGRPRGPRRAFCGVFDAAGKRVPLRSPDRLTVAYGDAPGTLYVTATDDAPIEPAAAAPVVSNPGGLPVSIREDRLTVGRDSVTWGADGCLHGFRVVCLNGRQWMDPAVGWSRSSIKP